MLHFGAGCMAAKVQRVFGTSESSTSQNLRNSFALLDGGSNENTKQRVEKTLLLFQM